MQATACATEVALASHLAAADLIENEQAHLDVVAEEAHEAARAEFRNTALSGDLRKIGLLIEEQGESLVNSSGRMGYENLTVILAEAFTRFAVNEKAGQQVADCTRFIGQIYELVAEYHAKEAAEKAVAAAERGLQ